MTQEQRQKEANKNLQICWHRLQVICPQLKYEFKVTEQDGDHIDFEINNYPFTVTWGDYYEPASSMVTGMTWVIKYTLSIWNTTAGDRNNPPESIDTELITSKYIGDCIKLALIKTAEIEIDAAMESDINNLEECKS